MKGTTYSDKPTPIHGTEHALPNQTCTAFQAGVEQGKATAIMCSYNAESYGNGIYGTGKQGGAIPSCANKGILNDLARDQWGFQGD